MSKHAANPFSLALNAQRELLNATTDHVQKASVAEEQMERLENVEVGQTPSEVVYEENKLELLHYESQTEEQHDVPILIAYALINRPYILDLQPDRSVVRRLLEAGHDVYLIDWNEPSRLDQHLTLDDYVNRYMDNCVDEVRERSGKDSINILGYCMGGTMSVMYTALHQEKVRTLGLMAAGLCFQGSGGVLEKWGSEEHYDPQDVTDAFGNMPAEILDIGFALMDPVANYVSKYVRLYDNLENDDFVENFARMERWLSEGIDVAGEAYVQFLTDIYQENKLYRNELYLGDQHIDITEIDVPMLQIMGEYDHLIPTEASKPFNDVVGSDDVETIEYPTGHIGLAVSGSSHRDVWPRVAQWYLEKSTDDVAHLAEVEEAVEEATGVEVDLDVTEGEFGELEIVVEDGDEKTSTLVEAEAEAIREAVAAEADVEVDLDVTGPAAAEGSTLEEFEAITTTHAERLHDAGVNGVHDLAEADPEFVAETAGVHLDEAREWVQHARDELESAPGVQVELSEPADEGAEALEAIDGIGPTYAERLREAGIDDVAALAAADVATVAEAAEVPESRASDWLEQAANR